METRSTADIVARPQSGDTLRGTLLGFHDHNPYCWLSCSECGTFRWVSKRNSPKLCLHCSNQHMRKLSTTTDVAHPKEGDIAYGRDIGMVSIHLYYKWLCCDVCGKWQWMQIRRTPRKSNTCRECLFPNHISKRPVFDMLQSPQIGDVIHGVHLGLSERSSLFRYAACVDCGRLSWVKTTRTNSPYRCYPCAVVKQWHGAVVVVDGENYPVYKTTDGYLMTRVFSNSMYRPMATQRGALLIHRLVMAAHQKRCLEVWEVVHHINSDRLDNRIENLELLSRPDHSVYNIMQYEIYQLRERVEKLQQKIKLDEWRISELEQVATKSVKKGG